MKGNHGCSTKKAGRHSENDSSKNQHSGKENTVSRSRQGIEYKKSIVIKASRSKVIAHNDGSKDK